MAARSDASDAGRTDPTRAPPLSPPLSAFVSPRFVPATAAAVPPWQPASASPPFASRGSAQRTGSGCGGPLPGLHHLHHLHPRGPVHLAVGVKRVPWPVIQSVAAHAHARVGTPGVGRARTAGASEGASGTCGFAWTCSPPRFVLPHCATVRLLRLAPTGCTPRPLAPRGALVPGAPASPSPYVGSSSRSDPSASHIRPRCGGTIPRAQQRAPTCCCKSARYAFCLTRCAMNLSAHGCVMHVLRGE